MNALRIAGSSFMKKLVLRTFIFRSMSTLLSLLYHDVARSRALRRLDTNHDNSL